MKTFPVKDGKLTVLSGPEEIAPDLFVVDGIFCSFGINLPHRMVIIRLSPSNRLVIYSPFSPTLVDLSSFGSVAAVIAPNAFHDSFARPFVDAHPGAVLYSSCGLPKKHPDTDWGVVLDEGSAEDIIDENLRVRVLTKFKAMEEIVLLHVPSKSLIACDLSFNMSTESLSVVDAKSRILLKALGATGTLHWSFPGRMLFRSSCKELFPQIQGIMEEWDWDRFVMSHGEIVTSAKEKWRNGNYGWVEQIATGKDYSWCMALIAGLTAGFAGYLVWKRQSIR